MEKSSHHLMNPSNDEFLTWTFATERLKIARMSSDCHACDHKNGTISRSLFCSDQMKPLIIELF